MACHTTAFNLSHDPFSVPPVVVTVDRSVHRLQKLYFDIPALRDGSIGSFVVAAVAAGTATGLRVALDPIVAGVQFITFFPAVILTTLITGWRAGAASVILCALAAWFVILPPHNTFSEIPRRDFIALMLFLAIASLEVIFISAMKYAIASFRELNKTLEERVAQRGRELMEAQQQLLHAEKLQAIGQLTGGLAHDLNNMLAIVMGNLDLLKRRLITGRTDIADLVEHALEGGRKAAELTKRLLAYARKQPLSPEILDVNKLVSSVSELLRRTLGGLVSIECIRSGGLWNAHADPTQLENAIVNLALNARDAMPNGGSVIIETGNASFDDAYASKHLELKPGQYVMIAVSDTGTGMSPEVLSRAIEPFYTTKADGKGTGLGLSQVFGFIKQSGGHFSLYSEEGKGTTVRMYLPRHLGSARSLPTPETAALPRGGGKIVMVVEDDDQVRQMTCTALRELSYEVVECRTAREALAELGKSTIDLLLTDVVMPGMNGRQLHDEAKRSYPMLRVLFMTGYTRNAIVHDGMLDHDAKLIVKPFTVEELAVKVRAVIEAPL